MNIVDIVIIAVIAFCFLIGLSRGFAVSFLSFVSSLASWLGAWLFYPFLSRSIVANYPDLIKTIINYTSSSKLVAPLESRSLPVAAATESNVEGLLSQTNFPDAFNKIIENNLLNNTLPNIKTIGEYFDHTIANILINIASFIILFIIIKIVFAIIISIVDNITDLPGLKQFDSLAGGVLGIAFSTFILFLIFALIPVVTTIAQIEIIDKYIEASQFASFFLDKNIFINIVRGVL